MSSHLIPLILIEPIQRSSVRTVSPFSAVFTPIESEFMFKGNVDQVGVTNAWFKCILGFYLNNFNKIIQL